LKNLLQNAGLIEIWQA